jgi:hypothetical protein
MIPPIKKVIPKKIETPQQALKVASSHKIIRKVPVWGFLFNEQFYSGCTNCTYIFSDIAGYCFCGLVYHNGNKHFTIDHQEHIRRGMWNHDKAVKKYEESNEINKN